MNSTSGYIVYIYGHVTWSYQMLTLLTGLFLQKTNLNGRGQLRKHPWIRWLAQSDRSCEESLRMGWGLAWRPAWRAPWKWTISKWVMQRVPTPVSAPYGWQTDLFVTQMWSKMDQQVLHPSVHLGISQTFFHHHQLSPHNHENYTMIRSNQSTVSLKNLQQLQKAKCDRACQFLWKKLQVNTKKCVIKGSNLDVLLYGHLWKWH